VRVSPSSRIAPAAAANERLLVPFACVAAFDGGEIAAFAVVAVTSECAGLIGPLAGASRRYDGPFGKNDRAFVLGVLAFWIGLGLPLNRYGHLLWLVLCIASIVTIVWRVRGGVAEVRTTQSPSMSE